MRSTVHIHSEGSQRFILRDSARALFIIKIELVLPLFASRLGVILGRGNIRNCKTYAQTHGDVQGCIRPRGNIK